jgi:hypothetical protein
VDTARLRAIVASMREADAIDAYNELDTEYHVELARISRNALLPVLMEALRGAMRRDMLMGFASLDDWRAERDRLVAEHEQIIGCIEGRDEDGAAEALRNHVVRFYRTVIGDEPGQLVGEVSGYPRSRSSRPSPARRPARKVTRQRVRCRDTLLTAKARPHNVRPREEERGGPTCLSSRGLRRSAS